MKLSFRSWLSIGTIGLILIILFFTRHELVTAWQLMNEVNLWILALIIPLLLLNYYAAGEMIFSYLRAKRTISDVSFLALIRLSLEINFVNHVMPSGGASGISYLTWRLADYGVPPGRATMAQAVRFAVGFAAFSALLAISVVSVTIDSGVNRVLILISSSLVSMMVALTVAGIYFLSDVRRVRKVSKPITNSVNAIVKKATFGKYPHVLVHEKVQVFLEDMHEDFLELKRDLRILRRPFIWALVFTVTDVAVYFVAFWALGTIVNPAPILIAYGTAMIAGFALMTPGGSGGYEALMVMVLAIAGLTQATAIAGVVLTRVIILVLILVVGYFFYHNSLMKRGRRDRPDL